jgi:exodeoxyribonuclease VII large subunit
MTIAISRHLKGAKQHLNMLSVSPALQSPTGYLDQRRKSLQLLQNRLISAQTRNVEEKRRKFVGTVSKLDAMSPLKVLTRGYVLVRTEGGDVLKSIHQVQPGDRIRVNLSDGNLTAAVTDKEEAL